MKKLIFCALLACCLLFSGCGQVPSDDPGSSRALYFSETHSLDHQDPYALCAVTVDQVLEHRYQAAGYESVVLLATVEEVFGVSTSPWFDPGDGIAVWVGISDLQPFTDQPAEKLEEASAQLCQILESSDSLILYGREAQPVILADSPEHDLWLADTGETSPQYVPQKEGESRLELPRSLQVTGIRGWEILPIRSGALDGGPLDDLIQSVGSEMDFSLDAPLSQGGQEFQDGDSADALYQAMRQFVQGA